MPDNILFTDLYKELGHLSKIDGMAVLGDAVDMHGKPITIKPSDLPAYVRNTQDVLESTRDSKGQIVGLPIDLRNHDHQGGAAWLVGLELDAARNVIQFVLDWTDAGIELVQKNISRYFSPSFDDVEKVILGGSLTNWPGSVDKKGRFLLRPVELSKSMQVMENPMSDKENDNGLLELLSALPGKIAEALKPAKIEQPTSPAPAELQSASITELLNTPEALNKLGELAEEKAKDLAKTAMRKQHVVEFAAGIAGGTKERPFGLAVRANEIVALLLSLPEPQALAVEKMLSKALDSAVKFAETGYDGEGFVKRPELPGELKEAARIWVESGKSIGSWFREVMPELGGMENYNVAEFIKKADGE